MRTIAANSVWQRRLCEQVARKEMSSEPVVGLPTLAPGRAQVRPRIGQIRDLPIGGMRDRYGAHVSALNGRLSALDDMPRAQPNALGQHIARLAGADGLGWAQRTPTAARARVPRLTHDLAGRGDHNHRKMDLGRAAGPVIRREIGERRPGRVGFAIGFGWGGQFRRDH